MTEDQIERAVERKVDRLDARFMAFLITQEEYDAAQAEIAAWADREYVAAGLSCLLKNLA